MTNEEKLPRMMTLLVGLGRMADMLADDARLASAHYEYNYNVQQK